VALPETLDAFGINHESLAVALVIAPEGAAGIATLEFEGIGTEAVAGLEDAGLEALRQRNPAGEALPLLQALAAGERASLPLTYLDQSSLQLAVAPC
jgi:hypothetical protein